jgi:hypothetical protein
MGDQVPALEWPYAYTEGRSTTTYVDNMESQFYLGVAIPLKIRHDIPFVCTSNGDPNEKDNPIPHLPVLLHITFVHRMGPGNR